MAIDVGSAIGYLDLDTTKFKQGFTGAMSDLKIFGDSTATSTSKLNTLSSSMSTVGSSLTKTVTLPLVGAGAAAVNLSAKFEQGMSEVKAISGATGDEMVLLKDKAIEMGAKTKFSAQESAEAFKYMAMAGWGTEQMVGAIAGVMDLAASSGEELGSVSDIVTDAMTAFGLSATGTTKALGSNGLSKEVQNATHFADVLAAASSASNTSVALMGETFKYVAPLSGALGFSIEDTSLAIGLMANAGIKGSQAGTALRASITNLIKPTDKMQGAMDSLGISVTNSDGSMKSLDEIMLMLRSSMKNMTEEQKAQTLEMVTGANSTDLAAKAMEGLTEEEVYFQTAMSLGTDAVKNYDEAQLNSALNSEYTKKELSAMTEERKKELVALQLGTTALDGLSAAEQASASATIFGKEAMSGMLAIINASDEDYANLSKSINTASNDVDGFGGIAQKQAATMQDNLAGSVEEMGGAIETFAITIGDILNPKIREMANFIGNAAEKLNSMSSEQKESLVNVLTFAALAGPVLLVGSKVVKVISTIMSVVSTISTAVTAAGGISAALSGIGATISGVVSAVALPITLIVASIVALKLAWDNNFGGIQEKTTLVFESIQSILSSVMELISSITSTTIGGLKTLWEDNFLGIQDLVTGVMEYIETLFSGTLDAIVDVFSIFEALFKGDWEGMWQGIQDLFSGIWETFTSLVEIAFNTIVGLATSIFTPIKEFFSGLWGDVEKGTSDIWGNIVSFFTETIPKIVSDIITWFSELPPKIVAFFEELPGKIFYALGFILGKIVLFVIDAVKTVKTEVPKIISNVVTFFEELPGKIWDFFVDVVVKIATWSVNMTNKVKEVMGGVISSVTDFFKELPGKIWDFLVEVVTGIATWSADMIEKFKTEVPLIIENVITFFKELPKNIVSIGSDAIRGIIQGMTDMKDWVTGKISEWCGSFVSGFKDALGIHSPSRVFMQLGTHINEGLAKGIEDSSGVTAKSINKLADIMLKSGDALSTGILTVDAKTNKVLYDSTYKTTMKKIDMYYKDRDTRIKAMKKGTDSSLAGIDAELTATQNAYSIKLKLYQQELSAKQSLVDASANAEVKALQDQLDEMDRVKKQEQRSEEDTNYALELAELQAKELIATEEEKAEILKSISELNADRDKELLERERSDKKEAINEAIEKIREEATVKKEALQQEYDSLVYNLEMKYQAELEYMEQLKAMLQKDSEERAELVRIQTELATKQKELETGNLSKEQKAQTKNEITELKEREKELKESITNNGTTLKDFTKEVKSIGGEYGDKLLEGFTSTETSIKSYLSSLSTYASGVISGIMTKIDATSIAASAVASASIATGKTKSSHQSGLDFVPYDGYTANLHKGEAVLTQEENRNRTKSAGDTFNFYSPKALDEVESARQMKRAQQELALGF